MSGKCNKDRARMVELGDQHGPSGDAVFGSRQRVPVPKLDFTDLVLREPIAGEIVRNCQRNTVQAGVVVSVCSFSNTGRRQIPRHLLKSVNGNKSRPIAVQPWRGQRT